LNITNKHNAPQAFINFCADDQYSRGDADYSVTDLLEEPRIVQLKRRHPDFAEHDPYENPWAYIGTMVHSALEQYAPEDQISEERIFTEIDGVRISGAVDVQTPVGDNLIDVGDYKTTTVYSLSDTAKWEQQLNVYAFLIERETQRKVRDLLIYAFLRDWKISMSEKTRNYPTTPGVTIKMTPWSQEDREEFVMERIEIHRACENLEDDDLPPCSHDNRWPSGSMYVAHDMSSGDSKYFKTKRDAVAYAEKSSSDWNMIVDKTFETYRRCKSYCEFANECNVWNEWKGERDERS
jgi:hypothetical protein